MRRHTERTIIDRDVFHRALDSVRDAGYAEDDGEQEVGVRCLAVAVPGAPTGTAISISGPEARMTRLDLTEVVPLLRRVATDLATELHTVAGKR
jgi:IclR family acetate operon transcriptional repressor